MRARRAAAAISLSAILSAIESPKRQISATVGFYRPKNDSRRSLSATIWFFRAIPFANVALARRNCGQTRADLNEAPPPHLV
jgi:hypothetical protein